MRANCVEERYITGEANPHEKFLAWASTVPSTIRNPLFHWTHMELKVYFHIENRLLCSHTAEEIYAECSSVLQQEDFTPRELLRRVSVAVLCTTDDPTDSLEAHRSLAEDSSFDVRVLPTFRPDRAFQIEDPTWYNQWVDRLEERTDTNVTRTSDLISALRKRQEVFHRAGCRSSDHGIEYPYSGEYSNREIDRIFDELRCGKAVLPDGALRFRAFLLRECALMYYEKNWVQQFHIGALRNVNARFFTLFGPDSGFDAIGDFSIAKPLVRFLDCLDRSDSLPSPGMNISGEFFAI